MHSFEEMGLKVPSIMLPKEGTDMEKWAVVACDQYTSEPDYWRSAEEFVGGAPSTLRLMLPEYYLGKPEEETRTKKVRETMERYLSDGTLRTLPQGLMLIRRTAAGHTRLGLLIAVDLEAYDYSKGSTSLIRATEKTIVERIPPRLRIRRGAPIELPHIIILIDDPDKTVIEPLAEAGGQVMYDTDLMLDGGHITGTFIPAARLSGVQAAFSALFDRATEKFGKGRELLMAMGDGNHSLATAKAAWEEIKQTLTPEEAKIHPARYALCELENVHDDGIVFEPIHRVMFGEGRMTGEDIIKRTVEILNVQNGSAHLDMTDERQDENTSGRDDNNKNASQGSQQEMGSRLQRIPVIFGGRRGNIAITDPCSSLEVGTLQRALDLLVDEEGIRIDYIHGEKTVMELSASAENAGFLLPAMNKFSLLPAVAADGALPRKTFSMGHANEKRYYLEARNLRRQEG